jgi:dCTP deaminase
VILSNAQIKAQLGNTVFIEPFDPANVNTSSYDVTLGPWYFIEHKPSWWRRFKNFFKRQFPVYNIWDEDHVKAVWGKPQYAKPIHNVLPTRGSKRYWKGIDPYSDVIVIPPKHTILAHTNEFIGGRFNVTTMMKARSSFGRNFIEVCKCAGYGDVGYTNRWTMEITNNSRFYHIPVPVGRRIAQIVFMQTGQLDCERDYTEAGKYQTTSDTDRMKADWHAGMMLPRLHADRDIPFELRGLCPHGNVWDDCPVCCH